MRDDEATALLRRMFDAAVAAADPELVVPPHLPEPPRGRTVVVGAGKASAAMARALERHWPGPIEGGLVVTRYGHAVPCERIEIVEAAHPVPDEAGRRAAERILALDGARSLSLALPGTAGAQQLFNACAAQGGGAWDHSGLVRALELMADHQVAGDGGSDGGKTG